MQGGQQLLKGALVEGIAYFVTTCRKVNSVDFFNAKFLFFVIQVHQFQGGLQKTSETRKARRTDADQGQLPAGLAFDDRETGFEGGAFNPFFVGDLNRMLKEVFAAADQTGHDRVFPEFRVKVAVGQGLESHGLQGHGFVPVVDLRGHHHLGVLVKIKILETDHDAERDAIAHPEWQGWHGPKGSVAAAFCDRFGNLKGGGLLGPKRGNHR